MEPVIPEPAQVEMDFPVESQEELQAPASSSMVRKGQVAYCLKLGL